MLELSSTVKEPSTKTATASELERFMQTERSQPKQENPVVKGDSRNSVKQMLRLLQDRFSHTDDFPNEVESLIEEQVQVRTRDLFRQANYDGLTHLPNRSYFNSTLEKLVSQSKGSDNEFTLLFLDLDGFKNVNDTYGHHAGDELLRNVSARLISAVREGDIVSRLGGDEFVILLAGLSDREMIEGICLRIISEVSRSYWIDRTDIRVSTSIGVARFPEDAQTSTELVEKSDKALYVSKDSGRNTYRFYSEIGGHEEQSATPSTERLDAAFKSNQIQVCFEPQMDLASQKIVGASVSALWMDEGIENPYLQGWSDLLNQSSWGNSVGTWLVDSGLFYLNQWQQVNDEMMVSIPIVKAVWQDNELVSFLNKRLETYQVKPAQLQLEFSMQDFANEALQPVLAELSKAGYQITLTEVGKVPLDIALLSTLSLHEIKLDRAWLQESIVTENGRKWIKAVIQMASVLDVCVIATGITSKTEMVALQRLGCRMGQGSKWSLPLEADGFYRALSAQIPEIH